MTAKLLVLARLHNGLWSDSVPDHSPIAGQGWLSPFGDFRRAAVCPTGVTVSGRRYRGANKCFWAEAFDGDEGGKIRSVYSPGITADVAP